MNDQDLARAEAFGRLAARTGQQVTMCPYEANGNAGQRVLAARFVAAYIGAGGTVPVDYGDGEPAHAGRPAHATGHGTRGPVNVTIIRKRLPGRAHETDGS